MNTLRSEEILFRGSESTYLWTEATYEDSRILQRRVGLDTACAYAEAAARDAEIARVLTVSRTRYLRLKAMDDSWATGARHSVLSNAEQLLPAVRS
jgi:hypothetical protein